MFIPKLSDSFKIVIARSGATKQSQSLKERFLAALGMTVLKGLYIKTAQFRYYVTGMVFEWFYLIEKVIYFLESSIIVTGPSLIRYICI
jgi:hypothetical protein